MYLIKLETHDGTEEHNIPYALFETLYYCDKHRRKWRVLKCRLVGVWATNIVGVTLECCYQRMTITEDDFKYIFKTEDEAIQCCLKENQKCSVKVIRTK